jgi:methylamine utilization protein MauE
VTGEASVFPVGVAAYVVLFVLVIALVERVVAPRALPAALMAHRVVPRRAAWTVAVVVTVVEAVLAALLLAGLVLSGSPSFVLAGAAALFAAYGGYAWYVTTSGHGGPCGCGTAEVPMGPWVSGRAFVLAALALTGAAAPGAVPPLTAFDSRLVLVLLAAATIATLLWHLPAAMARPEEVTR